MLDQVQRLAVSELVIYSIFFLAGVFVLIRHGRRGLMAWFFFLVFCILRLVASGIRVHENSTTGAIINSVGLAGLLLTTLGVIHEAHSYEFNHNVKVGWLIDLQLHLLVVAGVVMGAIGSANLYTATTQKSRNTYQHLQEAGSIILLVALIAITLYALKTRFTIGRQTSGTSKHQKHSKITPLVDAAILALPFLYVRVFYGIVYAFTHSRKLNPITGSFVIQVVLITVVQTIAALILLVGGLLTLNVARDAVVPVHREYA